jgi:ATP phosphoribosyltransferase
MTDMITVALTKGRVLQETLPLLAAVGIAPLEDLDSTRKLVFATTHSQVQLVVLRGSDVPTYVQFGTADMGVSGKDVILEHGGEGFYELLDLGIARCRLMTAGIKNEPLKSGRIRVATKFVNIARRYYAEQGRQVDVVKLYGAMELAPIMGLADEIVDIVDTGNTLRANGLEEREVIAPVTSRLIINKAAMKTKHEVMQPIIDLLAAAIAARNGG